MSEIQVPPPGQHPHQSQMNSALLMFVGFAGMAVVLSAVLVAAIVSGMLAQQVRQIGVMKAIGARTGQIVALYMLLVLAVGVTATILGMLPTMFVARGLASVIADLLNLNLVDQSVPWHVYTAQALSGIVVPLGVALVPIVRASRITVRQAIDNHGIDSSRAVGGRLERWIVTVRGLDRSILVALRNTIRRRSRLLLTVGLLSVGGAQFMTGLNTAEAWSSALADGVAERRYDVEVALSEPTPVREVLDRIGNLPGVQSVETWRSAAAGLAGRNEVSVVRTYPDGGHGSFTLLAPPAGQVSALPPVLLDGRSLKEGDTDGIVLNQQALGRMPHIDVGDRVELTAAGQRASWRVVGIVREVLTPATGYVTTDGFARAAGAQSVTNLLRIVTTRQDDAGRASAIQSIERALEEGSIPVRLTRPITELAAAMDGHVLVLVVVLILTAILTAVVGTLGLATTMSINVLERTREFGVMIAIGATAPLVRRMVITEAVTVGILSWLVAVVAALPLSKLVGSIVGTLAFRLDLPLVVSPLGVLVWLTIAIGGSAVASAAPAHRASRLTVREALAYA